MFRVCVCMCILSSTAFASDFSSFCVLVVLKCNSNIYSFFPFLNTSSVLFYIFFFSLTVYFRDLCMLESILIYIHSCLVFHCVYEP